MQDLGLSELLEVLVPELFHFWNNGILLYL